MNKSKVAQYTRNCNNSLDTANQLHENRLYANEHSLEIVHEYADDNTTKGSQLEQMLLDVEQGLFDTIIVYRLDRISRTLKNLIKIEALLNQHNIGLVSVKEQLDTRSGLGRAILNQLSEFQKFNAESIIQREQFISSDSNAHEELTPYE